MSETMTPSGVEQAPNPPTSEGSAPEAPPSNRVKFDARGRMLPRTDAERAADAERIRELVAILAASPSDDPPGETEAFMRAIDSHRGNYSLLEGYY